MDAFGKFLRDAMKETKTSQVELSNKTGFSKSIINKLLSGEQEARYSHIEIIAKAMDLLPGDFFNNKDDSIFNNPIVTETCTVRPLFQDVTGKAFLYSIMAHHNFIIEDVTGTVPPDSVQAIYIKDGSLLYGDKMLHAGDIHYSALRIPQKVYVKKGSYYYIFFATTNKYDLRQVLKEYREKQIRPEE